jgi:glycosyl transferase family 87
MEPAMGTDTGLASRHQAPDPGQQRRDRVLLAVGIVVAAAAAGLYAVALATHPAISTLKGFDLQVYLKGGELARHSPAQLYSWHQQAGIQFTYTPFAALLFALITWVPFHVLLDVAAAVSIASLTATVWIAFRELGWRGMARTGATLLVTGVALWLEPVQRTLFLGQIELMLMALIVWDLCQPDRRWWKGAATGIAAGIKLVPLLFIVYLLVTRRFRQAAVATMAFAVTVIVGFAVLPHQSVQWWLRGYFLQASRTGFIGTMLNQSERGLLTRLIGSVASAGPLWLAIAIVTGIVGLAAAALLDRAGYTFAGLMVCALTALLVSPISWDHHWVWIAPGLAVLVDAAFRAYGSGSRWACAAWAAAAAGVVVAFAAWPRWWTGGDTGLLQGGLIWYAPLSRFSSGDNPHYVEYHWHGLQQIAGNLYVIAGGALFVLALAAGLCALRTWRSSQRQASGTPQPGTPQRSRT